MAKHYIELGDGSWGIVACYGVTARDTEEVASLLRALGCSEKNIYKSIRIITRKLNSAFTFSNTELKMSLVCIGETTSSDQLINSLVHEAKHVQSHVCEYYNVDEDSERASYLIGYIVQMMYKEVRQIEKRQYGRF